MQKEHDIKAGIVLGIETSCDETAVALYGADGLLAHQVYSQIPLHAPYGGVVPELASRDHIKQLAPLIQGLLTECELDWSAIACVAYTRGPGLVGALLVGSGVAKALAYSLAVPAIGVHHMEAHLMAAFLQDENQPADVNIDYPYLAALVSGGHTQIIAVNAFGQYELLGETLDDAVGEVFDKVAKMLDLPYPGGPHLSVLAEKGDANAFTLPRPMTQEQTLMMSYSGLKTAVRQCILQQENKDDQFKQNIAASFQAAIVDTVIWKLRLTLKETGLKQLVVVGGVSANKHLRKQLDMLMSDAGGDVLYPPPAFCTDNAAMVAYTGWMRFQRGESDSDLGIHAKTRWDMREL